MTREAADVVPGAAVDVAVADALAGAFGADRANAIARNAVTSMGVNKAARNPVAMRAYADTFGVSLKAAKTVTNQRHSGRCWLFATLNVLRARVLERLDVEDFEFSQAYGMFYDKLEKANAFLNNVVATADLPWDDRTVEFLLQSGTAAMDGGEFAFAANLIAKWGAVPKTAMPETASTKDSSQMNATLGRMLHRDAVELRRLVAAGEDEAGVTAAREAMLADVHRVLCACLGEPPTAFDLELSVGSKAKLDEVAEGRLEAALPARDGDDEKPRRILRERAITPREFVERYVGFDPADYVELVHVPATDLEMGHAYGVRWMDTVSGGAPMRMLNVDVEKVEDAAMASLKAGVPCYMACDVMQEFGRNLDDFPGTLALGTLDREGLFGVELGMSRADMLDSRETCFTHAMTFQGVELGEDGRPAAWRVENSWGKDSCKDGYLIMSGEWYRLYGGDVVVERRFVDEATLKLWDEAPLEYTEPWGVLASAMGITRI